MPQAALRAGVGAQLALQLRTSHTAALADVVLDFALADEPGLASATTHRTP